MLLALEILVSRMVIIFAVMGVLYLGIIILKKLVRTEVKKEEGK
jgi:hypothetical protein